MNTVNCFNSMVRCKRTNNNISLMPRCIGAIIMVMSRPKVNIVYIHAVPIIKAVGMLCAVCVCIIASGWTWHCGPMLDLRGPQTYVMISGRFLYPM